MLPERPFVGTSTWDGTLSPDEFRAGALAFAGKWESISHTHDLPLWSWVSSITPPFVSSMKWISILAEDLHFQIDDDELHPFGKKETSCLEIEACADPAMLVQRGADEVHDYDFHILHNNSYKIPVLYFRGYNFDGQKMMLDQIERDLPVNSAKMLTEAKWTFITQQDHPYLNRPRYTLHPC